MKTSYKFMPMIKWLLPVLMMALVSFSADAHPDEILGIWQNGSGKGHIQIYKDKGKYFGKIIWLNQPTDEHGKPKVDKKNPNESMRSKPIIGSIVLRDFSYDDHEWSGGKIYNPEDGKEYKSYLKLKDPKTLAVRGYIGFSWIGKTDTWTRIR